MFMTKIWYLINKIYFCFTINEIACVENCLRSYNCCVHYIPYRFFIRLARYIWFLPWYFSSCVNHSKRTAALFELIWESYQNIVSFVETGKAKSDSLATYFITTCNVRIARSMFHAETTGVFQRFDYLWTRRVFVEYSVSTAVSRLLNCRHSF